MQTIEMTRKLSHDFKLTARTAPEIYEAVSNLVTRAASEGVKFRARKVGIEALVNALLIDLLDKAEAEQLAMLRTNIPRFERLLNGETGLSPVLHEPPIKITGGTPGKKSRSG